MRIASAHTPHHTTPERNLEAPRRPPTQPRAPAEAKEGEGIVSAAGRILARPGWEVEGGGGLGTGTRSGEGGREGARSSCFDLSAMQLIRNGHRKLSRATKYDLFLVLPACNIHKFLSSLFSPNGVLVAGILPSASVYVPGLL